MCKASRTDGNWGLWLATRIPAALCLVIVGGMSQGLSRSIEWKVVSPHVHVVKEGVYTTPRGVKIEFTAVRFHLGYTRMRLLDSEKTLTAGRDVKEGIARSVVGGHARGEVLSYSLEGMLARLKSKPLVMAAAGWSRSQRFVEHVGLLRIDKEEVHKISPRPALTAILCLNDVVRYGDYDAMVPVVFHVSDVDQLNPRAAKCPDAVQIGPRIVEEGGNPGIGEAESRAPKSQRVVFAVDDPGRTTSPPKSRDAGRNGYLLVTHNPVNLFDLQALLLDKRFYGGGSAHWAANLAGSNLAGMVLSIGDQPEFIENSLAVVGSVLIVEPRPN